MPANQPKFIAVPANPGWWAKIAVHTPERDPQAPEFVYEPVALWLVYYDEVLGVYRRLAVLLGLFTNLIGLKGQVLRDL